MTAEMRSRTGGSQRAAETRAGKAREDFLEWRGSLEGRAPAMAASACAPNLEVVFGSPSGLQYACAKCGQQRTLSNFRRMPCVARPGRAEGGPTRQQWIALVRGRVRAEAYVGGIRKIQQSPRAKERAKKLQAERMAKDPETRRATARRVYAEKRAKKRPAAAAACEDEGRQRAGGI